MTDTMKCQRCEDGGWVCENHPDRAYPCECDGAGMPCPDCNVANIDNPPRLPKAFEPYEE